MYCILAAIENLHETHTIKKSYLLCIVWNIQHLSVQFGTLNTYFFSLIGVDCVCVWERTKRYVPQPIFSISDTHHTIYSWIETRTKINIGISLSMMKYRKVETYAHTLTCVIHTKNPQPKTERKIKAKITKNIQCFPNGSYSCLSVTNEKNTSEREAKRKHPNSFAAITDQKCSKVL